MINDQANMTDSVKTVENEAAAAKYWHDMYVATSQMAQDYAAKVGADMERLENELQVNDQSNYEKGFVEGAQHQMKSSVDKAVNRMAQPEQEPWLLESTKTLAKTLAREFYPEVTQWECLNDLAGVISQIDNMTTGLMRKTKQEPVAWMSHNKENFVSADDVGNSVPNWTDYYPTPLYTTPPKREWVGLTYEERINLSYKAEGNECVAVELTEDLLKEKNT